MSARGKPVYLDDINGESYYALDIHYRSIGMVPTVEVVMSDGNDTTFVTMEPDEAEALAAKLEAIGAEVRRMRRERLG